MNENEKHIEEFIKGIEFDDAPNKNHRDSLEQKLLRSFPKHRLQRTVTTVWKWSTIMNSKVTKLAAAAVIVVAVLAGLNLMSGTQSIALADVLENVMDITSFSCRMRTTDADTSDYSEFGILSSKDYGERSDAYVRDETTGELKIFASTYILYSQKDIISVIHELKQYTRVKVTGKLLDEKENGNGENGNRNPRLFLEEFLKHGYTELGPDTIDGVDVVGFESTDIADSKDNGRSVARIWVDVRTELPVRIEAETFAQDGSLLSKMTTYGFDWNVQVDQSDFTPVIPDDYVDLDFGEDVEFSADENSVINGLKFYAEIFDGKYPESLAVKTLTLSSQIEEAIRSGSNNFIAGKTQDQLLQELGQGCMLLEFTAVFCGVLASENKAVAYYGDKVTADNPDAVLMRWREDDGRYKVIFGDLTIKKVTEAALAELEAMPIIKNSK